MAGWMRARAVGSAAAGGGLVVAAALALAGAGRAGAVPESRPPGPGVISTVAGGPGGPARATRVALGTYNRNGSPADGFLCGVTFGDGRLYVGDDFTVRAINPATGWLRTIAGTGVAGPLGIGGLAGSASVSACGVAVDASGNVVIASNRDNRIRVVAERTGTFYGQSMKTGHLYVIAGTGGGGFGGDGGPASGAELTGPLGVTVDAAGNVLVADMYNQRVRVIADSTGTFYGQAMTAGDIYTIAGSGAGEFSGDGGPATEAALDLPAGVAVDAAGNVVIDDYENSRIRVVAQRTGTFYGQAMTAGDIYTVAGGGTGGLGDGGPATSASLNLPSGVYVDSAGNLLIADTNNRRVRVVADRSGTFYGQAMRTGDIYSIAGDGTQGSSGNGGPATRAELNAPDRVTVDGNGNVVITEFGGVGGGGLGRQVRVVARSAGRFYGQAMTAGDIYAVAGGDRQVQYSGDRGPATSAELNQPAAVAVDGAGNLLIADQSNNRIRVVAENSGIFYGQAMKTGNIYTVAGTGAAGSSGDGGPATRASLHGPIGIIPDRAGNVLITDSGSNQVRVIAERTGTFYGQAMKTGNIYALAGTGAAGYSGTGGPAASAELNYPQGIAEDSAGNVLITDNNRIRVIAEHTGTFWGQHMTAGDIYTIAGTGSQGFSGDGGPATSANLASPTGVILDSARNLVINDYNNQRIRVLAGSTGTFYGQHMTAGDIYTIAGTGIQGFSGDGGPATSAEFDGPDRAAFDSNGNLVIVDWGDGRVRVIAEHTGTFYGQAMTAGNIYSIAGTSQLGFSGDKGPASKAELDRVEWVTADGPNLLLSDAFSNRIRMITS